MTLECEALRNDPNLHSCGCAGSFFYPKERRKSLFPEREGVPRSQSLCLSDCADCINRYRIFLIEVRSEVDGGGFTSSSVVLPGSLQYHFYMSFGTDG